MSPYRVATTYRCGQPGLFFVRLTLQYTCQKTHESLLGGWRGGGTVQLGLIDVPACCRSDSLFDQEYPGGKAEIVLGRKRFSKLRPKNITVRTWKVTLKVCRMLLRIGAQDGPPTSQNFFADVGEHQIKQNMVNILKFCEKLLSDSFEMFVFGKTCKARHFCGQ